MELRQHQELAIKMARESICAGRMRPIIAAPTSFGKTVLAASMFKNCQDKGRKGKFYCDRIQLIEQSIVTFSKFGIDFGVEQAEHELYNPSAPIQITSIQTEAAKAKRNRGRLPVFHFGMVDECQNQYEIIKEIITKYNNTPIIGLSATPLSKGLGKYYNDLLVPVTARELLDLGYLCPIRYYSGAHVDLGGIKTQAQLEERTTRNKEPLTGGIIKNWFEYANGMQSIAFTPSCAHSRYMVDAFCTAGVQAEHIDGYMSREEQTEIIEAHDNGEFKILSCSRLLNTGYDSPQTACIIDCYPTNSLSTYIQRLGRIMRILEGKEYGVYLDHGSNFGRDDGTGFGYAEDFIPDSLHDGESPHKEADLVKSKEKKDAKTKPCPQCPQMMQGMRCRACGYTIPITEQMEDDGSMLKEVGGNAANKKTPMNTKERFYSDMLFQASKEGKKSGWAGFKYKERFGVWPDSIKSYTVTDKSQDTINWQKHCTIKRIKGGGKRHA